jgi:hypothetical protein
MRYKVRASTDHEFLELLSLLRTFDVEVFVCSPRRRFVSTGDLSGEVLQQVAAHGGMVSEDRQYDLEHR